MIHLVVISGIVRALPRDLVEIRGIIGRGRRRGSVVTKPTARQGLRRLIDQIRFLEGHGWRGGRFISGLGGLRHGWHVDTLDRLDLARRRCL